MSDASSYIQWMYKKLKLNDTFFKHKETICRWKVHRGQIYTCFFGENIGFEKSKMAARPCIIVSKEQINEESGNVIVVPLSKNIKYWGKSHTRLRLPYHYALYKSKYPKLTYDSAVQCEDVRCVSKSRLCTFICNTDPSDMKEISKKIKNALQL